MSPSKDNTPNESTNLLKSENPENGTKNQVHHTGGLSVLSAAIFIAGEMAGSGVLALPKAIVDTGWIGIILVFVFCFNSWYASTRLGYCWTILEERYPEHRGASRNPYPTIAYRAVGRWGSILVSACVQITLFGAGVVYLLLASQIVQDLLAPVFPRVTFCSWFIVFAMLITPPMWLGSPKDFWAVGVGALVTTALSCIFMFTQMVIDMGHETDPVPHRTHGFMDFFLAFGIILFAFGGASTFPTIQNDMADKSKFLKSAIMGFIVIISLYFPVTLGGYLAYGERVNANVIVSLGHTWLTTLANIFMAAHLVLAFLIVVNPVSQELENYFDVPTEFCMKRCVVRTCMVVIMIIIGELIPQFSKLLALVGGSTVALATFVLPNFLYMKLCDQESDEWPKRHIPMYQRVYMWECMIIGLVGGAASTYSAFRAIFSANGLLKNCFFH